jgi:hypothetical protein
VSARVKRRRSTSRRCSIPVNTVLSSLRASPSPNRSRSSALLFAHEYCVRSSRLARVRSAAARYRNHVASGTRAAYSGAIPAMSSTNDAETTSLKHQVRGAQCLLHSRPRLDSQRLRFCLLRAQLRRCRRGPLLRAYSPLGFRAARRNRFGPQQAANCIRQPFYLTARVSTAPSTVQALLCPRCDEILLGKRKSVFGRGPRLGCGSATTHPQHAREIDARRGRRFGIERIQNIDPRSDAPVRVVLARKERARDVLPLDSAPTISVMAPTGRPPSKSASTSATPVGATGRMAFCTGVNADGMRWASAVSIWTRIVAAEGIDLSSPYFRLYPYL